MMSLRNKVIWTEGMFLQPHHFQQQERHLEHWIEARCAGLCSYSWGLTSLEIDPELLALSKISVKTCHGVFPDGTPFAFSNNQSASAPIEIPEDCKNEIVYLALPVRHEAGMDVAASDQQDDGFSRYRLRELQVEDAHSEISSHDTTIQSGDLWLRYKLARQDLGGFVSIPIARVVERKADQQVVLDEDFIPACLHVRAAKKLSDYIESLQGLLLHRGEELAQRIGSPGAGGIAEFADFLLLQIVNRHEPLFAHLSGLSDLHPEALYRALLQIAGELATITQPGRRPSAYPSYQHDDLKTCVDPVYRDIQTSLNWVSEKRSIPIPLEEHKHQIYTATVPDRHLFQAANFVLAIHADMSTQELQRDLPRQITIATPDKLRDLVMTHTQGVELRALAVAPTQIPFHSGFSYFELDKACPLWTDLTQTGTIAMHFAGEYPGIQLEFWAIRG